MISIRPEMLNGADLAFVGDAYYDLRVRMYLLDKGITNPNKLHKEAVKYVSATAHSKIMNVLKDKLTEEEIGIFKRGRNYNYKHSRKNLKLDEYLASSGFEAVIGYLFLLERKERIEEILALAIKVIEEE